MPAATVNYAEGAVKSVHEFRGGAVPDTLYSHRLNYFTKNGAHFYYPYTLLSAGVVLGPDQNRNPGTMFTDFEQRDPEATCVLVDSGGYSIKKKTMNHHGNSTREKITDFNSMYRADGAITLDRPPGGFTDQIPDFGAALENTLENLDYTLLHSPDYMISKYLSVLQGESQTERRTWYDAVKTYPYNNWALAGEDYKDIGSVLDTLVIMLNEGKLDETNWLHMLGFQKLTLACAATTVQETLIELLGHNVTVTFDSAGPFNEVNEQGRVYRAANLTTKGFSISRGPAPDHPRFIGSDLPFPYRGLSSISEKLTLGDLCVNPRPKKRSTWDDLSYLMLQNHNLEVTIAAIIAANARYALPPEVAVDYCPPWLIRAKEGIHRVLTSGSIGMIDRYSESFKMLNKKINPLSRDDF